MKTLLLTIALILLASSTTRAQEVSPEQKAKAKELYERAKIHYRTGDLESAAVEFKQSYEAFPRPETLFNMAQTQRLLKNYDKAIFYYKQYLSAADVNERDRQLTQDRIKDLETLVKEQQQRPVPTPAQPAATSRSADGKIDAIAQKATERSETTPAPHKKRTWVWGVVGGAVIAVGLGIGLGVGLTSRDKDPTASFGAVAAR